jgi:hypothetical protein
MRGGWAGSLLLTTKLLLLSILVGYQHVCCFVEGIAQRMGLEPSAQADLCASSPKLDMDVRQQNG